MGRRAEQGGRREREGGGGGKGGGKEEGQWRKRRRGWELEEEQTLNSSLLWGVGGLQESMPTWSHLESGMWSRRGYGELGVWTRKKASPLPSGGWGIRLSL